MKNGSKAISEMVFVVAAGPLAFSMLLLELVWVSVKNGSKDIAEMVFVVAAGPLASSLLTYLS